MPKKIPHPSRKPRRSRESGETQARGGKPSEKKFIDALEESLPQYCIDREAKLSREYKGLKSFKLSYPDGPFLCPFYNLFWEITTEQGTFQSDWQKGEGFNPEGPEYKEVRRFYKGHPEAVSFFVGSQTEENEDDDREYQEEVLAWFKSKDRDVDFTYGMDDNPAFEFQIPILFLVHEIIASIEKKLQKSPKLKKLSFAIEGHDGTTLILWNSYQGKDIRNDVKEYRKRNGFTPSLKFMKEYLALFTSNKKYIETWSKRFVNL